MTGFSKRDAVPGMAHFRGSGPVGKTCADCAEFRDRVGAKQPDGTCDAFYRSARKRGAVINPSNAACQKFLAKAPPPKPTPAPVPAALPTKACAMPKCTHAVDPWAQFCGYHWFGLPDSLQSRIVAARRQEGDTLAEAVATAIQWLTEDGRRP